MNMLKPFFGYFGGKYRIAPKYPKPTFQTVVEPFAGAAGYALRYPEKQVILVEKNPEVAAVWAYLVKATPEQILKLPLIDRAEQNVSEFKISIEEKLLIGFNINAGSATPRNKISNFARDYRPPWEHTKEDGSTHPGYENFWGAKRRERIARQVNKIKHWRIIEGDYKASPKIPATWFVDPPYEKAGKSYPFNDINRKELAEWCLGLSGQLIVCEAVGAEWLPFQTFGSFKSTPGKKRAGKTEEAIYYRETL
jgi:site-specific DNA-adenine methylase